MKQIRFNTFETNSSSTHSLVISTEADFEMLKNGKFYVYENDIITLDQARKNIAKYYSYNLADFDKYLADKDYSSLEDILYDCEIYSYDQWIDAQNDCGLKTYVRRFETPSGDKMVAWGRYGYNG
ncbi:MAG: hypothetical protein J6R47_05060 [Acholeplasmatales bacterium]|nr:hypothetical protein [Acholeplasmatales bacterium]